jgi:hypothetical protein
MRYRGVISDSARWESLELRGDDIIISTPPKCGTTWTQMICALLIFQTSEFYASLDLISPWLDMLTRDIDSVVADLDAQRHRRFIKTHTPLDGLPWRDDVTYICVGRDPRDVFVSWDHHLDNLNIDVALAARERAVGLDDIMDLLAEGPRERAAAQIDRFWEWVDDDRPIADWDSLPKTLHHLTTFWDARDRSNITIWHYDDLRRDLEGEMRMLAKRLAIDVPETRWPDLVEAASFEHMRDRADRVAPDTTNAIWHDNESFFHRGMSGQWRALLDEADVERYFARIRMLGTPSDLVAWLHRPD